MGLALMHSYYETDINFDKIHRIFIEKCPHRWDIETYFTEIELLHYYVWQIMTFLGE